MVTTHFRGHKAYWDGSNWRYADNDEIADYDRPCVRCGKMPTSEGYDACLGYIPGALYACCGHGVDKEYVLRGK